MRKLLLYLPLFFFFTASAFGQNWDWGGPMDPLQEKFKVLHYQLELEILPESKSIQGKNTVTFEAAEKLATLRLNLIDEYQVSKVTMNGEEVEFSHENDILDITPIDCTCNEVTVYYGGVTPIAINPPWTGGFTWEVDQLGYHWMGLSSQGEGAKVFMPALDHPSSEPSNGVDLYFTVEKPYFVASNGNLLETKERGDKTTYHWSTNYSINNYGINFTLGVFTEASTTYTSVSGKKIPMHVYVLKEDSAQAETLLEVLEVSTATQEKFFGAFPFPEDKIAVVETPYLGMEHQTINAYGNNFRFIPMGDVLYDNLLHHELGHEWFGNKMSVGDWADMWIHEGFTAYGDWLFYEEHGGHEAYLKHAASVIQTLPHARPVLSPVNSTEEEAYHGEIYSKGASIVHGLRGILGDEVFFPMLKAFISDDQFTYQNQVKSSDFIEFVHTYTGNDLSEYLNFYLKTTNLPELKIKKKGSDGYEVSLRGIKFSMPVEVQTSEGIKKIELGPKPVLISSNTEIQVDPNKWFMIRK
ncbi:M1 family metallopeptidase [Algoriphagus machipongonensis]|uniref:Aminopeptidase M1 family protein n=1 Tax=Algoriphagus machipongonensis TaxID=388413 RepID=A3HXT6_9BACT|nr:M1 family metallopeptidase [Algoriphagus machipongonensis]EAZ81409.1 putative aminopeptidase M1 family protein [Algoriphagus machipongonensis]